jgi:hypothetical protein
MAKRRPAARLPRRASDARARLALPANDCPALAAAPGSGGCLLACAPDSRGPGLAAPDRAAGRWLAFSHGTRAPGASAPSSAAAGLASCPGSLLPTAVVVGQMLCVLLLPAPHTRLAPRIAPILARAIPTELRRRLLLPALCAALQDIRGRRGSARYDLARGGEVPTGRLHSGAAHPLPRRRWRRTSLQLHVRASSITRLHHPPKPAQQRSNVGNCWHPSRYER